jgi:hypothetical protein
MHSLVSARLCERLAIATQDDMPERDRRDTTAQRDAVLQRPRNEGSVQLDDSVDDRDPSRRERGGRHEGEPNQAIWRSPDVPNQ